MMPYKRCNKFFFQVDFNASGNVTMERQTFCCVPIPGENDWVKNVSFFKKNNVIC